jgi:hypothetical protein
MFCGFASLVASLDDHQLVGPRRVEFPQAPDVRLIVCHYTCFDYDTIWRTWICYASLENTARIAKLQNVLVVLQR